MTFVESLANQLYELFSVSLQSTLLMSSINCFNIKHISVNYGPIEIKSCHAEFGIIMKLKRIKLTEPISVTSAITTRRKFAHCVRFGRPEIELYYVRTVTQVFTTLLSWR